MRRRRGNASGVRRGTPGAMATLPSRFLGSFLGLLHVHYASVCLDGDVADVDPTADWTGGPSLWGGHPTSYAGLDRVVSESNRPSGREVLFVLCPRFDWKRSYPDWAFRKNVIWMVAEEEDGGGGGGGPWQDALRLDSRFYTYAVSKSSGSAADVVLHELFRVKGGPVVRQALGRWNADADAEVPRWFAEEAMWERRSDLGGIQLVDTVLSWQPYMIVHPANVSEVEKSGNTVEHERVGWETGPNVPIIRVSHLTG